MTYSIVHKKGSAMFFRYLLLICSCAVLIACNPISAALTSTNEKINSAVPLQDATKVAYNALVSSLDGNSAELKALNDQYAKLMGVRALTCTTRTPIRRFDTIANIRAKVKDTDCFQKQDARLVEWIGLQRLSIAINLPALEPLSPFPGKAMLPNFSDFSGQASIAAEANVLIVKGAQQFTAVQLPSGKAIHSFPVPDQTYRPAVLSANGRVLAIPVGSRNLRMVEIETGNTLWSTDDFSDLITWLPQAQAALLIQNGTGIPHLLDIKNGKIEALPATKNA